MLFTGESQAGFTNKTEDDTGNGFLAQASIEPNPPYHSGWTMARYSHTTARTCTWYIDARNASTQQWTTFDEGVTTSTYIIAENYWLTYYDYAICGVVEDGSNYAYADISY